MIRLAAFAALTALACGPTQKPIEKPPEEKPPLVTDAPLDWSKSGVDWSQPPAPTAESDYQVPKPQVRELANGMKLVVIENRRLPLVTATLVIRQAGSASDPSDRRGLAGLTADLLDEGTGELGALALAGELERLGSYLSSAADTDMATVTLETLRSTLPDSLLLMSNVARAPTLAAADFQRIKQDRLSMILRRSDQPRQVASLLFDKVVFGGHPYAHPAAGFASDVRSISLDEVRDFHRRHYTPGAATLLLVGDIDGATAADLAGKAFGGWQGEAPPAPPPAKLGKAARPHLIVVDKPGAPQSVVRIGRRLMTRSDPRYFAGLVANTALGGSFTSRLNNRLREQLGYTYGAGSSFWLGRTSGTWSASTSLKTEVTVAGIREMLALIESMRSADLPADELARVEQLLVRRLPSRFETNSQIAGSLADLVGEQVDLGWYAGYRAGVEAIDADAVRAFAAASWDPADQVMVVVGDLSTILDGLLELGFGQAIQLDPEGAVLRTHQPKR